jgi:hypothetical protein
MKAVTGEMMGTEFEIFPSVIATWEEWRTKYPQTSVLSRDTGFGRNYSIDPYAGYEGSTSIMFPIKHRNNRFHPKERVLVVISEGIAKAYPFSELKKVKTPLEDKVGGKDIVINFNDGNYIEAKDKSGNRIESFVSYWFAWYTFKPDTLVFTR